MVIIRFSAKTGGLIHYYSLASSSPESAEPLK